LETANGWLVWTVSVAFEPGSKPMFMLGASLFYRSVDGTVVSTSNDVASMENGHCKVYEGFLTRDDCILMNVQSLPAGRYQFYTWNVGDYYPVATPPVIEFEMRPGKAIYVGNILTHVVTGRSRLGLRIPYSLLPEWRSLAARDLPFLKEKYPDLSDEQIIAAVPQPGYWAAKSDSDLFGK